MRNLGASRLLGVVALSALAAGCGGNSFGTSPGAGGTAQAPMGHTSKIMVAPGKAGQLVASHFHVDAKGQGFAPNKGGGCIYLSDNSTSTAYVYNSGTLAMTGTLPGGWGAADTKKNAFLGQSAGGDTIYVYKQCQSSGNPVGTLTGFGSGSPYGLWASDDGSVISTDWPNNQLDQWGPGSNGNEPYLGAGTESNMGLAYFVWYDALDKKSAKKGEKERILVNGWNINFSSAQLDSCTRPTPPALTCKTLVANSGGFPGGVIAHHDISSKYQGSNVQNVVVNDQYGTLNGYACDIDGAGSCTLNGSFFYASNVSVALDYTAIVLGGKCKDIWGANIFYNANQTAIQGDAQQNTPDTVGGGMALGAATAAIPNAVPLGITVSKPCKDT